MSLGGVDWDAICAAMQQWVVAGSGLSSDSVMWAQQDAPRPAAPAIMLRISNIAETGQSWTDTEDNPLVINSGNPLTVTAVDATANTLTIPSHGLLTGDGPFDLASTVSLPGNAPATPWVIVLDSNTIQLAATYIDTGGGQGAGNPTTPVDLANAGAGTITLTSNADTLRAGEELAEIARCYLRVTLELHCHAAPGVGLAMATSLLQRVRLRRGWSSQKDILDSVKLGLIEVERVRAVAGVRDALLFEPRAYLDVHFCVPAEETDFLTLISTVDLTDLLTSRTFRVKT